MPAGKRENGLKPPSFRQVLPSSAMQPSGKFIRTPRFRPWHDGIPPARRWAPTRPLIALAFALTVTLLVSTASRAATNELDAFTRFAESEFQRTRALYETNRTDVATAWQFARACFDRAELANGDKQRASLAEQGIATCRAALQRAPADAAVNFYLALNLGQLARTKGLGALKLVKEMEELFHKARTLDETIDHAGPDRSLGLLYQDAPGWPTSVGSKKKSLVHLRRAVELDPDFPENRLNLAATLLLHHRDRPGAEEQMRALAANWDRAKTRYSGEAWAFAWSSWESQRTSIERRLAESSRGR